jgi:hypothetical protein
MRPVKIDRDLMITLRKEGKSYREIAAVFGCSGELVRLAMPKNLRGLEIPPKRKGRRISEEVISRCPYLGLARWLYSHPEVGITELAKAAGWGNSTRMWRLISGANSEMTIETVIKIEEYTGLPFAELFRRSTDA